MRSIDYYIDCGECGELDIEVEYDYTPPQRATHLDPPWEAEVTLTRVTHRHTDVSWMFLDSLQNSEALYEKIVEREEIDRRADAADHYYDMMKERKLYESA